MLINFNGISDLAVMLSAISIVLCPTLCGLMAYQVSRTYKVRNAD